MKSASGVPDGERDIFRQELAVMLYRYMQTGNGGKGRLGSYSGMGGASEVAGWADDAMRWAVGSGILSGDNQGNLNPTQAVSRGEVSVMLMRFAAVMTG